MTPRAISIDSVAALFETKHDIAAITPAICYLVAFNDRCYCDLTPLLLKEPGLRAFVDTVYGATVTMVPDALVVPLGKAARTATEFLIHAKRLDARRCLLGFLHRSGANGWRAGQYGANREMLQANVTRLVFRLTGNAFDKVTLHDGRGRVSGCAGYFRELILGPGSGNDRGSLINQTTCNPMSQTASSTSHKHDLAVKQSR